MFFYLLVGIWVLVPVVIICSSSMSPARKTAFSIATVLLPLVIVGGGRYLISAGFVGVMPEYANQLTETQKTISDLLVLSVILAPWIACGIAFIGHTKTP